MKNRIHIGVVNFETIWGDKESNLASILKYCEEAGARGVDLLVFPETALTGYQNEQHADRRDKMQVRLAETIPGPSTETLSEYAKNFGMYIILGMPERDPADAATVYNAAAILYPDGRIEAYRKIHLPGDEADWCVRGKDPVLIETPWGPVGIGICYDTYVFPELLRYYRSKGARLYLNVTACPNLPWQANSAAIGIPTYAFLDGIFIASADLCGREEGISDAEACEFIGGSSVIGPQPDGQPAKLYIGTMFLDQGSLKPGLYDGTIDLSVADGAIPLPVFTDNERIGDRDFRADLYAEMYRDSYECYNRNR